MVVIDPSFKSLFIIDNIKVYPYNNLQCLAYNPRNNKKTKLDFIDTENAEVCNQFLTFEEHVDNIFQVRSDLNQTKEEIEDSLKKIIDAGFMITPREIIDELREGEQQTTPYTDWKNGWNLAIGSADRPELLSRLLTTITPFLAEMPVKPRFLMIDDSRDPMSCQKNSQTLKIFCETNSLEYEFYDRKKRTEFCNQLATALPNCKDSIEYLLSPNAHSEDESTYGQVRNFAVLQSIGRPLLMLDDDCLINPMEAVGYRSDISLGYSGERGSVKSSYDELFISLQRSTVNPFIEHLQVLGKTLKSSLLEHESEILNSHYWKHKNKEILADLKSSNFTGMSTNAIAGALNSHYMDWFYHLDTGDEQERASLLDTLDEDKDFAIDQATWNGRYQDEISKRIPLIGTTICGIAPLQITPPMPPVGRNEDLSLGATIRFLYRDATTYQFGWGLPHLPEPKRQWKPFGQQQEPDFNSTSFYIGLLDSLEDNCPYTSVEDRLEYLSMFLSHISESEITSFVNDELYKHHAYRIKQIKKNGQQTDRYPRFQKGCERMHDFHLNEMKGLPEKVHSVQNDVAGLMQPFSQGLSDWGVIWSHCRETVTERKVVEGRE